MTRLSPSSFRTLFALSTTAVVLATGTAGAAVHRGSAQAATATSVGSSAPSSARPAARSVTFPNVAEPARAGDPLAGGAWGVNTQPSDAGLWKAYSASTGTTQTYLARIALQPRNLWFHSGISSSDIAGKVQSYITKTQAGDPSVLVPMAFFRLWPYHESGKNKTLTAHDQAAYKHYMANAAAAIGTSRTAVILEPDYPVSLSGWSPSTRAKLVNYAATKFGVLTNTATYIDAGDSDWLSVAAATKLLIAGGIENVRGFALGATHYTSVPADLDYGRQLVSSLHAAGVSSSHLHFVIDTADNGEGFTFGQYAKKHPKGNHDNVEPCTSTTEGVCDTLGIAPTPITTSYPGLTSAETTTATNYADGYMWFGRPWLINQASPYSTSRAVAVAKHSPFFLEP